jgi:hypothetical protein
MLFVAASTIIGITPTRKLPKNQPFTSRRTTIVSDSNPCSSNVSS